MENNWQIERLISLAFNRTKERFLSYFLTIVLSFGISTLFAFTILILVGILFLVYTFTKSSILIGFLSVPAVLVAILAVYYLGAWYQLAATSILIQEEKLGIIETFKKVRPMVWGFVWYISLSSLFIWGLIPLGILSLGIVLIFWVVWSSFSVFVYLEKQKNI